MARDTDGAFGTKKEKERDIKAEKVSKREQPGMLFDLNNNYLTRWAVFINLIQRSLISTIRRLTFFLISAPLPISAFLPMSVSIQTKVNFCSFNVPDEKPMEVEEEEEDDQKNPGNLLDNLFKKTKTTPCLYWLPLTDEQVRKATTPYPPTSPSTNPQFSYPHWILCPAPSWLPFSPFFCFLFYCSCSPNGSKMKLNCSLLRKCRWRSLK